MSAQALPMLFINLGGEMVYILHQRLHAQSIETSKAQKVLNDIIGTMFNSKFMEELFKPQELHSKSAMRTVFDKLAHASIMRLNAASMDKLYDLMTMAIKYQVTLIPRARDLLLITLNHLDGLRSFVKGQASVIAVLDELYDRFNRLYCGMTDGQLINVRNALLSFFQDMHVRVSIFLKESKQRQTGRFILPAGGEVGVGVTPPGIINLYEPNGQIRQSKKFMPGVTYTSSGKAGSVDSTGDRRTELGTNIWEDRYSNSKPSDTSLSAPDSRNKKQQVSHVQSEHVIPDPAAKAQLDLLSRLIGSSSASSASDFKLNLFSSQEEEDDYQSTVATMKSETEFVSIDASSRAKNQHLDRVMGSMSLGSRSSNQDDDLLDLMDQAQ